MSLLQKIFGGSKRQFKPSHEPLVFNISGPTDVQRHMHVGLNPQNGQFEIEGLPESWQQWIANSNLT